MTSRTPNRAEVLEDLIESRLWEVHTTLPGRIESFDAATQKADVLPLIRRLQRVSDGEINEALPVITDVPCVFPRSGGKMITFPVAKGDFCKLSFCESSIDNWQASDGKVADPEMFSRFDLTDAVCELGWYPDQKALASVDPDDLVFGEESGAVIHVGGDEVNLYEKNAADFVALAQLVLDELEAAKVDRAAMKTAFDGHIHVTTATVDAGSPGVIAAPAAGFPTPTDPNPVAADKVKAT